MGEIKWNPLTTTATPTPRRTLHLESLIFFIFAQNLTFNIAAPRINNSSSGGNMLIETQRHT